MIPIILHDTFYLIDNMGMEEILTIANTEGLNSPKIRAKAIMQMNAEFFNSSMVKGFLSNIKMGFYEIGDKFMMKPIMSLEDLNYFIGPDGKKYTCDTDYYTSNKQVIVTTPEVAEIHNPEMATAAPVVSPENGTVKKEVSKPKTQRRATARKAKPKAAPVEAEPERVTVIKENIEPLSSGGGLIPITQVTSVYTDAQQEKLDEAEFLDGILSRYPKISLYVQEENLMDIAAYLSESKEDLDREVKRPFLDDARMLDIIDGDLGTDVVENTVGSSNNMFDSLLTFPVFSALVGKKRLTDRFSLSALEGSQFVRICPIGVSPTGELYGFVHMEEITSTAISRAESEIKELLKEHGKAFNKLSSQEKYKLFEEKLSEYYTRNSGKMLRASGSQKYVNIVEFLNNLASKKHAVPQVYDENEGIMLWPSHEIITFDNRGPKTLKEQLVEIYEPRKVAKVTTPEPVTIVEEEFVDGMIVEPMPEFLRLEAGSQTKKKQSVEPPEVIILPPPRREQEKDVPVFNPETYSAPVSVESAAPSLNLFDSIVQFAGTGKSGSLTLHDSTGAVIKDIEVTRTAARPPVGPLKLCDVDSDVVIGSTTMGGIDPEKPTKFVDEQGREWVSKEARDQVMAAIFGTNPEMESGKKK